MPGGVRRESREVVEEFEVLRLWMRPRAMAMFCVGGRVGDFWAMLEWILLVCGCVDV